MGERFTLDVDSFQRLLAAAWVLQCQRDRKTSPDIVVAETGVLLGRKVNRIPANFPIPSCIFEAETKQRVDATWRLQGSASQELPTPLQAESSPIVDVPLRPKSPASVSVQPEVSGALALASERHDDAQVNAIPFLLDELEDKSVWEKAERTLKGAAGGVLRTVAAWAAVLRPTLRVKLVIRGRARNQLARYAAPVFALLVVAAMLIPQISSRGGWLRSVRAAAHLAGKAMGVGVPEPVLETSHLRVTDTAESAVLDQMSRYEVRSMRREAEFGDETAALTLGMAYETGRGVPQNCREAARWVQLAAEDGNAAAEYNLGLRYLNGDGVREDRAEARKWIEAASQQGYTRATAALQSSGF
jgi:TPR repeat protein